MRSWQMGLVQMALPVLLAVTVVGCASQRRQETSIEEPATIERPARPLGEEEGLADRIGEVGVVLLVVGVTVGAIAVPLLLLGAL
jgi:hypothetical protein